MITFGTAYSQSDSVLTYLPLQIGNQWQYKVYHIVYGPNQDTTIYYSFSEVERDTIMPNGYQYQVVKRSDSTLDFLQIDSITACVYSYNYDSSRGIKIDSLRCSEGDWFGENYYCAFIDTATVLNFHTYTMGIENYNPEITVNHTLAMNLGPVYLYRYEAYMWGQEWISNVVYARINGVEYGVIVNSESGLDNKSLDFDLYQNFPNPFNPVTSIQYTVSSRQFVSLKVYDVLGNEIATLVNEEKQPGTYEVEFNTQSHSGEGRNLTSGIYFYQLKSGNFEETKKMLLLK